MTLPPGVSNIKSPIMAHRSRSRIIVFDGVSAAGKSTYSSELGSKLRIPVVHSDDFFPAVSKKMSQDNMKLFSKKLMDMAYKEARKHRVAIVDGNWEFGAPAKTDTVLIYTDLKNMKRNIKLRPNADPVLIMELYHKLFERTDDPSRAIDRISKREIRDIIEMTERKLNRKQRFRTKKLMDAHLQHLYKKLKFGDCRKIYIAPKLTYDVIIKTSEYSPDTAAKFIATNI